MWRAASVAVVGGLIVGIVVHVIVHVVVGLLASDVVFGVLRRVTPNEAQGAAALVAVIGRFVFAIPMAIGCAVVADGALYVRRAAEDPSADPAQATLSGSVPLIVLGVVIALVLAEVVSANLYWLAPMVYDWIESVRHVAPFWRNWPIAVIIAVVESGVLIVIGLARPPGTRDT